MKVLVVDDSVVFRTAIKTSLISSSDVKEVKTAGNGKVALEMLQAEDFNAVTLDLEMPVMDGVETIKEIRKFNKEIPIIIFSAQNLNAANKTLKALEMGANDFVQKIEGSGDVGENLRMIQSELIPKFKAFIEKINTKKTREEITSKNLLGSNARQEKGQRSTPTYDKSKKPDLICIGSSTGGPDTLKKIFKNLKKGIQTPILIVQHMPPIFTTQFAKALDQLTSLTVCEAKEGDVLMPGHCYLAPGDFHMELVGEDGYYTIHLNQNEKVCYVRPAVDVMLTSVEKNYKGSVATFILTGMGSDGADGCTAMKKAQKGPIFIQDEESSIVFGMPKAVYELGIYDEVVNIEGISNIINQLT